MSSHKTFGQIVRTLREEKGLSREMLCGDEKELSVRQLVRLEKGESKPTLTKIEYLADRLAVPIYQLMEDYVELPKRYLDLKYLVMRMGLFGQSTLVAQKEAYLLEMYEEFYDDLPEDEQVAVDVLQSWVDVFVTGQPTFGNRMLEEYFEQVKQRSVYQVNDLLLLELYFYCVYLDNSLFNRRLYRHFVNGLLAQDRHLPADQLFLLSTVYVTCVAVGLNNGYCDGVGQLVQQSKEIMKQIQDFQNLPIVHLQECQILFLKNRQLAEKKVEEVLNNVIKLSTSPIPKRFPQVKVMTQMGIVFSC